MNISMLNKLKIIECIRNIDKDAKVLSINFLEYTSKRPEYWEMRFAVMWERSSPTFADRPLVIHYVQLNNEGQTMAHIGYWDVDETSAASELHRRTNLYRTRQ